MFKIKTWSGLKEAWRTKSDVLIAENLEFSRSSNARES